MFTGIIEEIGFVSGVEKDVGGAALRIGAKKILADLRTGDSVAVSGPCLTVTALGRESFTAWAMPETLEKTNLRFLTPGQAVNLERAMRLDGRLGGHLVSGHVDTVVTLSDRRPQGGALILTFRAGAEQLRYIVAKGSVCLDGVSLTVVDIDERGFSIGLIPHTAVETTLADRQPGALVNLELDLIGKYVEKLLQPRCGNPDKSGKAVTMSLLRDKGYI